MRDRWRVLCGLWLSGLLNNSLFVITNALGKQIAAGGVALVYLANVAPALLVKGSTALWFPFVSYHATVWVCAALMAASVLLVALASEGSGGAETTAAPASLPVQLLGVSLGSLAGALGECSFLALASASPDAGAGASRLTAWSSGTGMAGVAGYAWVVLLSRGLGWSLRTTVLLALVLPAAWLAVFFSLLAPSALPGGSAHIERSRVESERIAHVDGADSELAQELEQERVLLAGPEPALSSAPGPEVAQGARGAGLGVWWRFILVLRNWEVTVPLMTVYLFEYTLQSGAWTAIGFPVESQAARQVFYENSNWAYQLGVLISRSSGASVHIGPRGLWLLPALQGTLLAFFAWDAVSHAWYDRGLLVLCLGAGLIGGAVYVHGFILLARRAAPAQRELLLASASVADTVGILLADVAGLLLQGCLYGANGITDGGKPPLFRCGYSYDYSLLSTIR
jgi:battenin